MSHCRGEAFAVQVLTRGYLFLFFTILVSVVGNCQQETADDVILAVKSWDHNRPYLYT